MAVIVREDSGGCRSWSVFAAEALRIRPDGMGWLGFSGRWWLLGVSFAFTAALVWGVWRVWRIA